jgi:hypothetical protein
MEVKMTTTTVSKRDLRKLFNAWQKGKVSKIEAERTLFGTDKARGKKIARLWESTLGVDARYGKTTPVA